MLNASSSHFEPEAVIGQTENPQRSRDVLSFSVGGA